MSPYQPCTRYAYEANPGESLPTCTQAPSRVIVEVQPQAIDLHADR